MEGAISSEENRMAASSPRGEELHLAFISHTPAASSSGLTLVCRSFLTQPSQMDISFLFRKYVQGVCLHCDS